jgi:hypothetical protein
VFRYGVNLHDTQNVMQHVDRPLLSNKNSAVSKYRGLKTMVSLNYITQDRCSFLMRTPIVSAMVQMPLDKTHGVLYTSIKRPINLTHG